MKIIVRSLLVLLLLGGVAMVGLKQNALATARAEHQALVEQSEEARKLAEQNKDVAQLRGEKEELEKLREQNKDLPKLRNQVRQLRRQSEELAALRAENQRLLESQKNGGNSTGGVSLPADYITKSSLADAGLGTPETALQTFLWALMQGNFKRMRECTTPEAAQKFTADSEEDFRKGAAEMAQSFPGYRIAKSDQVSSDEVVFTVQIGNDADGNGSIHVKRIGSEWKVSQFN